MFRDLILELLQHFRESRLLVMLGRFSVLKSTEAQEMILLGFGAKGTERKGKFKLGAERAKLYIARKKSLKIL